MRIIVWGINYAPEVTGIGPFNTGMCDSLRECGHAVEMVTSFPYYPVWQKRPEDQVRSYRREELGGILVHRCWHYVPRRDTTLRRIWHELSFGLSSFFRVLFLARADVYIVISPPLVLGPLAGVISWLKRRPFVFHVQDLQPDAAVALGMVAPGRFTGLLYRIEALAYRRAALVSGISNAMLAAFARKGVAESKQYLLPNWIRWSGRNAAVVQDEATRTEHASRFRKKFHISRESFLVTYAGNLGRKQGLDSLIRAAELLRGSAATADAPAARILILIAGDGVMRAEVQAKIGARGLENVRLLPLLPEDAYHGMLVASDIGLILQAPGTGGYFLPSKLLSVLSMGLPVITAADDDSELARAVGSGGFGLNVPTGDAAALAAALVRVASDRPLLRALRRETTWVAQFSANQILGRFENKLLEIAGGPPRKFGSS